MKLADSLRLFAFWGRSAPENWGPSQALCTFCALHSRKWRGVSGGLHAFDEIAESLKLFALFVHAAHENGGTSQAVCMLLMKLPAASGCLHFLGAPLTKMAERLMLFAFFDTPMMKLADSLRL